MWELILQFNRPWTRPGTPQIYPGIPINVGPLSGEVWPRVAWDRFAFRGRTKLEAAEKAVNSFESVPLQNTSTVEFYRCLYLAAATAATEERNKTFPPGAPRLAAPFSMGCSYSWRYISPTMRTTPARAAFNFPFLMGTPRIGGLFGPRQKLVPTAVGRAMNRLRAPKVMTGFQTAGFQTAGCCGGTVAGCGGPACGGAGCKPAVGCKEPTAVGSCLQYVYTDLAGSGCGPSTPCDIGCGIGC